LGEKLLQRFFYAFCARSRVADIGLITIGAAIRGLDVMPTDMALQKLSASMINHRHAAIGALGNITTIRTLKLGGISSPIQKEDYLVGFLQLAANCFLQTGRK